MYQHIIFDLDGTLTDSGRGILNSVRYALDKMGVAVPEEKVLRRFIGPPLTGSFIKWCGMSQARAEEGLRLFRERYIPTGWRENRVYPGIRPLLRALKGRGCRLYVATGKSEESALRVLAYFGLLPYLDGVAAPKPEDLTADKAQMIRSLCPAGPESVIVGDTLGDVQAGLDAGVDSIAVGYGFGEWPEEAQKKATHFVQTVSALGECLLGETPRERGIFLTLEGLDGCGKTTQRETVRRLMEDLGYETVVTREPGGCPISEKIRELLLSAANSEMTPTTEALLYAASRAQHTHEVIAPALKSGKAVICDRYVDSSLAYQGGGRELGIDTILQYNQAGMQGLVPDVTICFEIDRATSLKRRYAASAPDRMEQAEDAFFARTEEAFRTLKDRWPDRYLALDGRGAPEEVEALLSEKLPAFLQKKGLI